MPSVARSRRLPEPFAFFIDRSLGTHALAEALRGRCLEGESVHVHDDYFDRSTADVEWIAQAGSREWVVLTKDAAIRHNEVERRAVIEARVALFTLGRGDLTAPRMADVFVMALPGIRTALRRFSPPVIATVSAEGHVSVMMGGGSDLRPPKRFPAASRKPTR